MNAVPSSLRLGFAGTPSFAVAALDALARSRHTVAAVFTKPDKPAGRGQAMHSSPIKQRAEALRIPVHQPQSFKIQAAQETLRGLNLDALVVAAYGLILPPAALGTPKFGCFNIHASMLPRWRGAAPIHRALLAGDAVTGVTIMHMDAGLDTGPMLARRSVQMDPRETAGSLHDRLARLGGQLIVEALDGVADGTLQEEPQPSAGITYAEKINKAEAMIDWNDDAGLVLRRVRAFNPWPIAETRLDGAQLRIWDAELAAGGDAPGAAGDASGADGGAPRAHHAVSRAPPGTVLAAAHAGIDVACGRGVLRILRLQLAGRRPLAAQEFIKALRLTGARFADS